MYYEKIYREVAVKVSISNPPTVREKFIQLGIAHTISSSMGPVSDPKFGVSFDCIVQKYRSL